jgi:hypothetical protein
MSAVVIARADDEIADLIDRIRSSGDPDVGLVVPGSSQALRTPLNVRLLAQFSNQSGRRTAIVSEDPRVQELARASGLQVYGSVPAYERGIELAAPRVNTFSPVRGPGLGAAAGGSAAAVLEAPPPPPPAPPPLHPPVAPTPAPRLEPRRIITQMPPTRTRRGWDRRRWLSIGGAAVAIIGIILFMTLSPSAKITITIDATALSVNSTIQGSTNASLDNTPDHVLTGVVNSTATQQFQAAPTGTLTIPAAAAKTTVTFTTSNPAGYQFTIPQGNAIQSSDGTVTFEAVKTTFVCIGSNGNPATQGSCGGAQPNASVSVVSATAGASGNVAANTLVNWPSDPCPQSGSAFSCVGPPAHTYYPISVTNNGAATGGVDARQTTSASAGDVANWTAQVQQIETVLTGQLNSDMQARAAGKTFAVDPAGNGKTISFAVTPPLPAAGAQFAATQITVSSTAVAAIYDPVTVRNAVIADLDKLVKAGDELAPGKLNTPPCTVTQASTNGTVVLSCSATDFSQPTVNLNTLKAKLTGRNPGSAQKIIQGILPKAQNVQVSESPFKLFYLPLFASRIEIIENFVAPASNSS